MSFSHKEDLNMEKAGRCLTLRNSGSQVKE